MGPGSHRVYMIEFQSCSVRTKYVDYYQSILIDNDKSNDSSNKAMSLLCKQDYFMPYVISVITEILSVKNLGFGAGLKHLML